MYKATMTFTNGSKFYKAGDDVSKHPRLQELLKKGLAKEIKTVAPSESKSTKRPKRTK